MVWYTYCSLCGKNGCARGPVLYSGWWGNSKFFNMKRGTNVALWKSTFSGVLCSYVHIYIYIYMYMCVRADSLHHVVETLWNMKTVLRNQKITHTHTHTHLVKTSKKNKSESETLQQQLFHNHAVCSACTGFFPSMLSLFSVPIIHTCV